MKTVEGFIYVGFAEVSPLHTVTIELFAGHPSAFQSGEKTGGKIIEAIPPVSGLPFSSTPLWFALKGDNMRYEITVFQDLSCEISHTW